MLSQLTRYASEFDLAVRKAELDIRATFDQRGKLMLGEYSAAAEAFVYRWEIESDGPVDRVVEVLRWIERGCHTLTSLRNPVPVMGSAVLNGEEIWQSD